MSFLVGRQAPDFVAPAILAGSGMVEHFHLYTAIRGKFALLFFNPLAFTAVCASELAVLDRRIEDFRLRGVEVLGVTLDAQYRHSIWRNIPVERPWDVSYNIVVDRDHRICQAYGLERLTGECLQRGAFLIDPCGTVRYQAVNDLPLQDEIEDLARMANVLRAQDLRGVSSAQAQRPQSSSARDQHASIRPSDQTKRLARA